jgi:hypothetical protein
VFNAQCGAFSVLMAMMQVGRLWRQPGRFRERREAKIGRASPHPIYFIPLRHPGRVLREKKCR